MRKAATQGYSDWLSSARWDLFVTVTDPNIAHPEAMLKQTRWFMNRINRHLYGRHHDKRGQGIEYVIGIERQKRGSAHSHTLVRFPDHAVTPELMSWMKKTALGKRIPNPQKHEMNFPYRGGLSGNSKIEIPRDHADVTTYVCKYVTKEGELHFSPNLNPYKPQVFADSLMGAMA
jgi:hypothetical protein